MLDETLLINLQVEEAEANRDTISKLVYKNLFDWIVRKVNLSISREQKDPSSKFIGILDIFGFEIF